MGGGGENQRKRHRVVAVERWPVTGRSLAGDSLVNNFVLRFAPYQGTWVPLPLLIWVHAPAPPSPEDHRRNSRPGRYSAGMVNGKSCSQLLFTAAQMFNQHCPNTSPIITDKFWLFSRLSHLFSFQCHGERYFLSICRAQSSRQSQPFVVSITVTSLCHLALAHPLPT